jgi:hypothetical protein
MHAQAGSFLENKQTKKKVVLLLIPAKKRKGREKKSLEMFVLNRPHAASYLPPLFPFPYYNSATIAEIDRMETPESTEGKKHQTIMTMMMGIITHHP